jgi:hypothetical protein
MKKHEMIEAMKCFKKDAYSPYQFDLIWNAVQHISTTDFTNALDELVMSTSKSAPTPADIRTACRPAIARAFEDRKRKAMEEYTKGKFCRYCMNMGLVEVRKKADPTQTGFARCGYCQMAKIMCISKSVPEIHEWLSDLEVLPQKRTPKRSPEERKHFSKLINAGHVGAAVKYVFELPITEYWGEE